MFWPILRFVIVVPALVAIALQQAEVWKNPSDRSKVGLFVTVALVGAVEPLVKDIRDRRSTVRIAREATIREMLGEALAAIAVITKIPCSKLGMSAFQLRRRAWSKDGKLCRIARLRLSPQPDSNINWSVGKGVVGWCAKREIDVAIDVFDLHAGHRSEDEWGRLGPETTLGLSWEECELLRDKHGYIVATPINHPRSGRVIGVVTVDGPPVDSGALDTGAVRNVVRQAATAVARSIS